MGAGPAGLEAGSFAFEHAPSSSAPQRNRIAEARAIAFPTLHCRSDLAQGLYLLRPPRAQGHADYFDSAADRASLRSTTGLPRSSKSNSEGCCTRRLDAFDGKS